MILSTLRNIFNRSPLLVNTLTITSLIASADVCCQIYERRTTRNFDWTRLKNMATMGLIYYGPVMFYYYRLLDKKFPGRSPRIIAVKMFVDQFVYTVPSVAIFYVLIGKLEQKSWPDIQVELKQKYIPTYLTSCLFWPTAQVINFAFVPAVFRVAYISVATFVWMSFLSYIKNRPKLPSLLQKIEDISLSMTTTGKISD